MPLRHRLACAALSAAALAAAAPSPAAALSADAVRQRLAQLAPGLGGASGAYVVDLDDAGDEVLFRRREDVARIPASNEKLFTTAAALLRFGPNATLDTTLHVPEGVAVDDEGVLRSDVFLVGAGDPSLDDRDLRGLAQQLRDAGVQRITGGVVGDETLFDARRGGPRTGFAADRDMGGWLSALAWGHGRAYPGGNPAVVAANRLQLFLKQAGIKVGRKGRAGSLGDLPGTQVASVPSPPIRQLAAITNQPSDNFYAETLLKGLGARFGDAGTTGAGLAVVRAQLASFGIHPRLADGSGLSRANRVTPRQLVRLLDRMAGQEIAGAWDASLARFGQTGTLAKRLRGTQAARSCRGKTGTINGVSALSGYCTSRDGGLVAFSFLSNGVWPTGAKRVEDRMVRVIANFDG
ncbi:D-alanyl-D-alanine carboxypeptidase/D-alanyl-D-alanine-endopeptidase [Conexibacter sp. SYSU D00693]|uniref:D-alanyl-D-alanine carboxypeptidase/D-alanyl-D-alanine endopeptidase n=1 Tax=Conexibacter sp. SYSU D00693 TaxID=2812560 RepID=UPI00196AC915|nr:D-alanyl-D-alanine carboxypeptidase/D-alanyl-D-alanine-endopeptidase [Conexibacter sp. SYSU D00693]